MWPRLLAVFALSVASLASATITLDPTLCYTLSANGTQYLDSTNSVLKIQVHANRTELEQGDDKGVRFHFPLGENGWVVCEAHDEHYVGTTFVNPTEWSTEDSLASAVSLATIHISDAGDQVYITSSPRRQMTSTAGVSSATAFNWDIQQINCLLS
ncbi:hypothetical protein FB45DRAFT_924622 [Roridomyces roridus]|uniref:AA1-like domain-containing protein n=1 Tax=Roridomyces roridus TaxID=1738132 RepID=A0AAD7BLY7_9AGAR|nr:hypothetical protein FB45DRAFT_924622 [Roridomyces roridus]